MMPRRMLDYARSTTTDYRPAVAPKPGCRECGQSLFHESRCKIRPWAPSRLVLDTERVCVSVIVDETVPEPQMGE